MTTFRLDVLSKSDIKDSLSTASEFPPSVTAVNNAISDMQIKSNMKSVWQDTPTDYAYPTEKLVKDSLDDKINKNWTAEENGYIIKVVDVGGKYEAKPVNGGTSSVGFADITGSPRDNTNLATELNKAINPSGAKIKGTIAYYDGTNWITQDGYAYEKTSLLYSGPVKIVTASSTGTYNWELTSASSYDINVGDVIRITIVQADGTTTINRMNVHGAAEANVFYICDGLNESGLPIISVSHPFALKYDGNEKKLYAAAAIVMTVTSNIEKVTNVNMFDERFINLESRVQKYQGTEQAGKFLKVGDDGYLIPATAPGGAAVWGGITGTIGNQTDLQAALDTKLTIPAGTLKSGTALVFHDDKWNLEEGYAYTSFAETYKGTVKVTTASTEPLQWDEVGPCIDPIFDGSKCTVYLENPGTGSELTKEYTAFVVSGETANIYVGARSKISGTITVSETDPVAFKFNISDGKWYVASLNVFTSYGKISFIDKYVPFNSNLVGGTTWGNISGDITKQTDLQTAFNDKVDKVSGKDLSTNDFTDEHVEKLGNIQPNAEVNVQSDWNVSDTESDAYIKNKPSSIAPSAHAATHASGGTDAISIDGTQITSGTIDAARIPAGAFQKLVTVASETARKALTSSDVNKGDTVKQNSDGLMFLVVDVTKLSTDEGWAAYTAVTPWSAITGKPTMPKAVTVTLTAAGWNTTTLQQTVSVTGMTATCSAIITPDSDYDKFQVWQNCKILCIAQAEGTLTFKCSTIPFPDLNVNILMIYP